MTTTEPAGGKRIMNWLVVVLFVVLMVWGLWSTVGQWKSITGSGPICGLVPKDP